MSPTLQCPLSLRISLSPSLFLHVYPLDPFLHYPTPLQISFTPLEVVGEKREREGEEYKTTFSSPKQEHLLIVEVTVSVQPHALNTTLLVLMMHRAEGEGGKERD